LKYEELPDIPPIWIDFLRAKMKHSSAAGAIEAFAEYVKGKIAPPVGRIPESAQRLRQQGSVAIVANFYASLFGGPGFQIWKCLTAVKICEQLAGHGVSAVPVCWVLDFAPPGFSQYSIQLIDGESEIRLVALDHSKTENPRNGDANLPHAVSDLIGSIEKLGEGSYDPEVLGILRDSYHPGTTLATGTARLLRALMEEWGMIAVAPGDLENHTDTADDRHGLPGTGLFANDLLYQSQMQSATLPVAARVVDPFEVTAFAVDTRAFDIAQQSVPLMWPQASATVVENRIRRILEKYSLDPARLYSGADALRKAMSIAMPEAVIGQIDRMAAETQGKTRLLMEVNSGKRVSKAAVDARKKILYQLNRLKERFEAAGERRDLIVSRHLHRACNAMAPKGHLQEYELAGVQIPLRRSRAVLRSLYEKLDASNLEHQLIYLD
jgi:hypothetical protein